MNITRRYALLTASALAVAGCSTATEMADPGSELGAFFEEQFEAVVASSPELATQLGDRRGYDRWDNETEAFAEAHCSAPAPRANTCSRISTTRA